MENKINIAEILKDCPKGMELYSPIFGKLKFNEVNAINNRILVVQQNDYIAEFESDGRLINCKNGECLLFPSKGKTTWEGFVPPCEFKDGDIIADVFGCICIYKNGAEIKSTVNYYCGILSSDNFKIKDEKHPEKHFGCIKYYHLATEEEKTKLFDAIKANGYKWNPETKTLEKLVKPKFKVGDVIQDIDGYKVRITDVSIEDGCYGYESLAVNGIGGISFNRQDEWELVPDKFDITTLKTFDKVLMRSSNAREWVATFYSHYNNYFFGCGMMCQQCIPYEGNEHLLGATNECNEYFKNW